MMRSMYSAVSGLKTHQTRMDVIGNNIANVNTEAFKSSSVTFSEIMYQTISGASSGNGATGTGGVNAKQIGLGVTTGSTSISIETAGAAETTGNPFDLKLTDSQTTNFFIVSDGTNTMFTRAGSFYVDGNGYLCMSSTGYTLMGWQVDPTTGEIRKNTVSSLQVMSPGNQTSQPEATTKAYVSGVLDKNDSNLFSDDGYVLALDFYDSLGYGYTGKFKIVPTGLNDGEYSIELTDIIDNEGKSILKDPTDPTGETYLYNPGTIFSTGERTVVPEDVPQYVYDSTGVKCPIYNLGSPAVPVLVSIGGDGKIYSVEKNGNTYSMDGVLYDSVMDANGKTSYVAPTDEVKLDVSKVAKDASGNYIVANGKDVYTFNNGGNVEYYFKGDDGLYTVTKNYIGLYNSDANVIYSKFTDAAGTDVYVKSADASLATTAFINNLGSALAESTTVILNDSDKYDFYKNASTGKTFAIDKTTQDVYFLEDADVVSAEVIPDKNVLNDFTPGGSFTYDASLSWYDADPLVTQEIAFQNAIANGTLTEVTPYVSDPVNKYYVDAAGNYYMTADNGATVDTATANYADVPDPANKYTTYTYTVNTANVAYKAITSGDKTYYAEPSAILTDADLTLDTNIVCDGDTVYDVNGEYFTMDQNKNLYAVSGGVSAIDPAYYAYENSAREEVYIAATSTTYSLEALGISKDNPYTIPTNTEKYKPYTIVYDQNKGTFVSVGDSNQAEGKTLTMNLADIMVNHQISSEDNANNVWTSEDGFTTSNFSNIEIDFSKSMNYNNSGTSTMKALKGDTTGDGTGKKLGALIGLTVNSDGCIYGSYDNGNKMLLCQIAAAQFSNASGLEKVGENCYKTTLNSGDFDGIGVDISADGSSISTGELEMSNVDLSAEFTSMIVTQRGFQANSRVITTSDTLLEELINLKR